MHFSGTKKVFAVLLLAVIFTVMQITGYQIAVMYQTSVYQHPYIQNIGVLSGKQCVIIAVLLFSIISVGLYFFFTISESIGAPKHKWNAKRGWVVWGITAILLFGCWIPCYLAGYPGYYNYDAFSQIPQALYDEVPYSAHHPLLHTLVMGKIIAFGYYHGTDLNDGIALYSIFQMTICAAAFAYILCYLLKNTGRKWLYAMFWCYYAFFPPIAMFAMSTTKDILFSVCLQFTVVFLYELCKDMPAFFASWWKICRFAGIVLLACLLRKNGVYAFLCIIPFVIVLYTNYWKKLILLFGTVVLLYGLADKCLVWMLHAEEGNPAEMLSIPMQQIARVYHDYGEEAFNPQELEMLYESIDKDQLLCYNPLLADLIKNYIHYDVAWLYQREWISLWFAKGMQYPEAYVKAFLDNTYQAWYQGTSICSTPNGEQYDYFEMNMCAGGYRDSKAPQLLEFYRKIAEEFYYQKIPIVRFFFSIGGMFMIVIYIWVFAIYQHNKPLALAMLLVLAYCGTLFLGPVSLVRYYLILYYGFPVSIGYLFVDR